MADDAGSETRIACVDPSPNTRMTQAYCLARVLLARVLLSRVLLFLETNFDFEGCCSLVPGGNRPQQRVMGAVVLPVSGCEVGARASKRLTCSRHEQPILNMLPIRASTSRRADGSRFQISKQDRFAQVMSGQELAVCPQ